LVEFILHSGEINVHLTQFREIPEEESLRHRWNALVQRAEPPQVFFSWEWAIAIQRAYAQSIFPWVLLLENEDKSLVGLVALATDRSQRQVSFLGSTTGDYCDFLSAPGYTSAMVEAVLAECKKVNARITLANLPADSATMAAVRQAASKYGYYLHQQPAYQCPQVSLRSPQQREELKAVLRRKKMRRLINEMEEKFAPQVEHLRSWDEVESMLPCFEQAHVARFLATGRISILAHPERRKFLEELARLLSESGWLTVTRLQVETKSVGWNYGFQFAGSWFWYQVTFDTDLEQFSPGVYLLAKIVEEACDTANVEVVDLGLGAEGYKERFANCSRETFHLTLSPSFLGHLLGVIRYRAATLLKGSPLGERAARNFRASLAETRKRFLELGSGKTLAWMAKRAMSLVFALDEVYFYDCSAGSSAGKSCDFSLRSLDLNTLAAAAMEYGDDESTLNYLVLCAQRLRTEGCDGFALVNTNGRPVHFIWAAPFEGFRLEGFCTLSAPEPDSIVLSGSWTPDSLRRRGHYTQALQLIAQKTVAEGKRPWTFEAARNPASIRALAKAGFRLRYSLIRKRVLWWQEIAIRWPVPRKATPDVLTRI
jgi:CelD/BcsL family acetyltransferase involved in cellulose biosynthesis/RimJ/RimL family protein N-acetyltransferase